MRTIIARVQVVAALALSGAVGLSAGTSQTIAFAPIANTLFGLAPFQVTARASSGLPVSFSSTTTATCRTASGLVIVLAPGTCSIQATQSGSATFNAAAPVTRSFTVSKARPGGPPVAATGSPYATPGYSPDYLVAGDFNGDGVPDLVVAINGMVLLGNGSGGFTTVPGSQLTPNDAPPSSVVVGDFNGDGIQDLAIADNLTNGLTVLLGDGTGKFASAPGSPFTVDGVAESVVAGDFNGDGIEDLATVNNSTNNVTVLFGNGSGGFAKSPGGPYAVGRSPRCIAVGDFNNDSIQDLVVANGDDSTLTVLLGNGLGGFTAAPGSPFPAVDPPFGVVVGDFNGDGNQDVAMSPLRSGNVSVLLGNGSGGFTTAIGSPFSVGGLAFNLGVGDFNGDGVPDLAAANANDSTVTVLLGNGAGGFTPATGSPFPVGNTPLAIALADFNGDGILDFATPNRGDLSVSVLLGTAATQTPQVITFGPLKDVALGVAPFPIGAVSTSGLPVVFNSDTVTVCSVSGNIVTVLTTGTCSITASQIGSVTYAAAPPVTRVFTVGPAFAVTTSTLPSGTVNQAYPPLSLAAIGGSGTLTWTIIAGSLPAGMMLSAAGLLSGMPAAFGTFTFSVRAADTAGNSAVQGLSLLINPPLSITTTTLSSGIRLVAYTQYLQAAGGSGNYTWSVSGGVLPTGIALSTGGVLSGTPTISGSFPFTAQVSDGISSVTQSLALNIGVTLSITTPQTLPTGITGNRYSTTLAATGGLGGPYTWSLSSGTPPPGIAISSNGTLSGNPSVAGTSGFTVQVNDGSSPAVTLAVSLTVFAQLSVSTASLPNGTVGQAYTPVTLSAQGGSGAFAWSAAGLPSGLTLSSSGVLSGTPTAAGSSAVTVTAADSVSNQSLSAPLSLTVVAPSTALKLSTSNLVVGAGVNAALSGSLTASGGTPPYAFTAAGLPAGVTLTANGAAATVGGSSSTAGTFAATITVTDAASTSATAQLTIQILGLTTPAALPLGAATFQYGASFAAAGGTPPYVFSATGLPAGFAISGNGVLSGIAASPVTFPFTVQVGDRAGLSASGSYTVTIGQTPVSVNTTSLPAAVVGTPYFRNLDARGGTSPYTWTLLNGFLPAGLTLLPSGAISGIPSAAGTAIFAVQVTDASGGVASASILLAVTAPAIAITTGSLPSGLVSFAYPPQVLGATGGSPPYTFAITGGALPPGLSLVNGVIGGTPTAAGTFPFTISVTDSGAGRTSILASIVIRPATPDLVLLSGSVAFALTTGATGLPPAQTVGVQSSFVSQTLTYTVSVSPASPWLSVTSGGVTPGSLTFSLTSAAFTVPAGVIGATVTLTCTSASCQGNTQNVAVSLAVTSPPPQLSVSSNLLSFATSTKPPQAQTQALGIQNVGSGSLAVNSIMCEAPWCKVGSFPAALTPGPATPVNVTVDPSTLSIGFYRTAVDISASTGTISVPVTFFVSGSASMNLAPAGTQFNMQVGAAPGNPNGSFLITVAGGTIGWTATLLPGANWVTLNTASGTSSDTQPATVSYSINGNAAGLATGAYYATIEVASTGVSNSPQDYEVVLSVAPATQGAVLDPEPAGLLFLTTVGGTPPPQIVTVYSSSTTPVSYQAAASTNGGGSWLSVAPPVGTTSVGTADRSTVSINTAGLAQGIYTGGVSYAFSNAGVRTVNVTAIVQPAGGGAAGLRPNADAANPKAACSPTTLVPTETGLVNNFSAPATWPTPLAITLADDCGHPVTNASVVATFTNGDPELALPLANSATGLYTATWTPRASSPQVIITAVAAAPGLLPATAQISGAVVPNPKPVLTPNGTVNPFNPQIGGGLAPGTIVAVYGQNLAVMAATPPAFTYPLPTTINGTQVRIGGINAPLFYVSPGQINVQIPFELDPARGPYFLAVSTNGASTTAQPVSVIPATPALDAFGDATLIAVHLADSTLISQASPAQPGEYIVMFLLGMGQTDNPVATGAGAPSSPLSRPLAAPAMTLGGKPVTITFAGLSPGFAGLYQINLQVPPGTGGGNLALTVFQNGVASNSTILPVAY